MVTDCRLDRDIEHLARNELFHLLNQLTTTGLRVVTVGNDRQGVHFVAVEQHIHTHHVRHFKTLETVIQ
ncbi:Uncharacterised protein [Vibrio cholerae]|uniref:Uncharacterized protein n=1 Tax=Vibrio cholerae TaxID=666 RepID=A0A655VZ72_VIBCL|nr:Uncharacterised protein [Vibrio cholerae]CSB79622.1 Uncharacterised protein [Vibrio cholerae]